MKVLHFLFLIALGFTIFEFIWGVFKIIFNLLTQSINSPKKTNSVRIVKYVLFSAVAIQYVQTINTNPVYITNNTASIGISAVFMLLYLFGKYQNRATLSQVSGIANQFLNGIMSSFDSKLELILILGSVVFFIIGSFYPASINNSLTVWFTNAISYVHNTFFIGFIFTVIAIIVLINTIVRGSKIIGKLLTGQSFVEATKRENAFSGMFKSTGFGGNPFQNSNQNKSTISQEPEFTEYEEVFDEED